MKLKKLFSEITVGKMKLKNRLVMPAMHLGYCEDGFVTKRLIEFYTERAKGGVGLIIVGGCKVDKFSGGLPNFIFIDDDKYIPGLKKLTDAVHQFDVKISCQLYHAGRYAHSFLVGETPISASAVRSKFTGETPREMTKDEIKQTIENIALAALRAKKAGFDAIELLGSAGYLINQFLSPLTNKREDEYGGSFENRLRFPLELIKRVREVVGDDFTIGIRMSGDDFVEGSNTLSENKIIAKEYEKAGIDLINVTGGWHETNVPQISMFVPQGAFVYLAEEIKKEVNIPVIACNRINNVFLAEEILKRQKADLIGMARGLIADPELPNKAKEGRFDEIRKCIACNQGCFDGVFELKPITCLVNPCAGREGECKLTMTDKPKNILIIGAGPAGLECARVARIRGHNVTILEKDNRIGGQINLASCPPSRSEFKNIIEYYTAQIKKLGIKLELEKEATPSIVQGLNPDVVVVATGSVQIKPQIKGIENKNVVYAFDVLDGEVNVGRKVVVIGGGGVGCETALYLAQKDSHSPDAILFLIKYKAIDLQTALKLTNKGCDVTIVEVLDKVGKDIGRSTRWTVLSDLKESRVNIITGAKVEEIKEDGVEIIEKTGEKKFIPADTVVIAVGTQPENKIVDDIKNIVKEVFVIGDAQKVGKAIDAIYQGYQVGAKI